MFAVVAAPCWPAKMRFLAALQNVKTEGHS